MDTTIQAFVESKTITVAIITRDTPITVTIHPTRTSHYQATKGTATVRRSASLAHNAQRPLDGLCISLVYEIFGTSETSPVSLEVVSKTRMAVSAVETGVHPSSTRDSQETPSSMNDDGGKFAAAAISGFVAGCLLTVVTLALIWWRRRKLRRTTSIEDFDVGRRSRRSSHSSTKNERSSICDITASVTEDLEDEEVQISPNFDSTTSVLSNYGSAEDKGNRNSRPVSSSASFLERRAIFTTVRRKLSAWASAHTPARSAARLLEDPNLERVGGGGDAAAAADQVYPPRRQAADGGIRLDGSPIGMRGHNHTSMTSETTIPPPYDESLAWPNVGAPMDFVFELVINDGRIVPLDEG